MPNHKHAEYLGQYLSNYKRLATWFDSVQAGVQIAVAVALFGMAMGRVVSAAIDRALGFYPLVFLVIEIVLAAMLLAALTGRIDARWGPP